MTPIKTFAINLKERTDRKDSILKQFSDKPEFDLQIIPAKEHPVGAIGLWRTIRGIIKESSRLKYNYIILCEDDHVFTKQYSFEFLRTQILEAESKKADVILGGISWFNLSVKISSNLFWINKFSGLQFTVIFSDFFPKILNARLKKTDVSDHKISRLTNSSMAIYPAISVQKDFGYSDVTKINNNNDGRLDMLFINTAARMNAIETISKFYSSDL